MNLKRTLRPQFCPSEIIANPIKAKANASTFFAMAASSEMCPLVNIILKEFPPQISVSVLTGSINAITRGFSNAATFWNVGSGNTAMAARAVLNWLTMSYR